jgi:RNA polymerase sigma-70 factor (ECF subfamily)
LKGKLEFEKAVRSAYPTLYRAAVVLTGNTADAEDAVQETLMKAFRAYGTFRGEASPTTWMYRILVREAGRIRRKATPRPLAEIEEHTDGGPNPDREVGRRDEYREALRLLRGLPERQKEIMTLFYLEDLNYTETADALGVSVGTVKSALSRARAALRERLARGEAKRKVPDELPG